MKYKYSKCNLVLFFLFLIGTGFCRDSKSDPIKILFVGNSLTGYNDLPDIFRQLTIDSGKSTLIESHIKYGRSLYEIHLSDEFLTKINSDKWDLIVVQDSGHRIAYPENFQLLIPWADIHPLEPTLEDISTTVKNNCDYTEIVFFMPWAFKDGMLWIPGQTDDYFSMQEKININSIDLSKNLNLIIAPVGWAWYELIRQRDDIELFNPDLSHPSLEGSYLSACVLYVTLFHDQVNSIYYNSLSKTVAEYLQKIANNTVLNNQDDLNLDNQHKSTTITNYNLTQNFPNPFNPNTTIIYKLPEAEEIDISLYNINGEKILVLYHGYQEVGSHVVNIKGKNLNSGVYFYKLQSDKINITKKCLLIK